MLSSCFLGGILGREMTELLFHRNIQTSAIYYLLSVVKIIGIPVNIFYLQKKKIQWKFLRSELPIKWHPNT